MDISKAKNYFVGELQVEKIAFGDLLLWENQLEVLDYGQIRSSFSASLSRMVIRPDGNAHLHVAWSSFSGTRYMRNCYTSNYSSIGYLGDGVGFQYGDGTSRKYSRGVPLKWGNYVGLYYTEEIISNSRHLDGISVWNTDNSLTQTPSRYDSGPDRYTSYDQYAEYTRALKYRIYENTNGIFILASYTGTTLRGQIRISDRTKIPNDIDVIGKAMNYWNDDNIYDYQYDFGAHKYQAWDYSPASKKLVSCDGNNMRVDTLDEVNKTMNFGSYFSAPAFNVSNHDELFIQWVGGNNFIAMTENNTKVWRSTNNGSSWSIVYTPERNMVSNFNRYKTYTDIDDDPQKLIVAMNGGILYTLDGGLTWNEPKLSITFPTSVYSVDQTSDKIYFQGFNIFSINKSDL